jgi:hypothetical protein
MSFLKDLVPPLPSGLFGPIPGPRGEWLYDFVFFLIMTTPFVLLGVALGYA